MGEIAITDRKLDRRAVITGAWHGPQPPPAVVRPPGAVALDRFAERCDGCGKCAEACPADAIVMTGPMTRLSLHSPQILAEESPCVICEGLVCSTVCPTDALLQVTADIMCIARVQFDPDVCWAAQGIDLDCDYCFDRCPLQGRAITYTRGRGPAIDPNECTGCGVCHHYCPSAPKALTLTPA
jgi:ferredoxin-type protein NapG